MRRFAAGLSLLLGTMCAGAAVQVPLTSLSAINTISNAEASRHQAAAFKATVTYYRASVGDLFAQDGESAIYVHAKRNLKLVPGDRIQVRGTMHESFRPYVEGPEILFLYHGALPEPAHATFEQMLRAETDCRLVTVRALVRSANIVPNTNSQVPETYLEMLVDGGHVDAEVDSSDESALGDLLDAEVEITGAVSGHFDNKMQQTGVLFHVQSLDQVKILKRAGVDPWSLPITPMDRIITGYRVQDLSQRLRVHGTVTYWQPGVALVLQEGVRSMWITTESRRPLRVGDVADAIGFPDVQNGFLTLTRAEIRESPVQAPIVPALFTWRELALGGNLGSSRGFDLVSVEGKVIAEVRQATQDEYVIESDGHLFSAIIRHPRTFNTVPLPPMREIPIGAHIRVTGICLLADANPFRGEVPFNLLMRSYDDITIVARPSWLNVTNLMALVGILLLAIFALVGRGWLVEHRMSRQMSGLASVEQRRSRILEKINASVPLAEILEAITDLVSFKLGGTPCWCEIADGARLGERPADSPMFSVFESAIAAPDEQRLGTIFAAAVNTQSPATVEEALAMGAGLARLAIENSRLHSDLVHRSEYDLLTDVQNRFSLEKTLDESICAARQSAGVFGLIYVDLDAFKAVNDRYGHQVGDLYLQEVSVRMKRQLRPGDMLARLGGDEFAVLLANVRNRPAVEDVAQRLESSFDEPFRLEGNQIRGSASAGVALYPEDGQTRDELLSAANAAMYEAKHSHRQHAQANRES